jgi:CRP-like cAMP-binding protein
MKEGQLGAEYNDGEVIVRQGELGDSMYVVQEGRVEVVQEKDGRDVKLAELEDGDFFGEMALFEKEVRSATVRALGSVRILTVDKKTLLRRIHEDPSLAFRVIEKLCKRLRVLNELYSISATPKVE